MHLVKEKFKKVKTKRILLYVALREVARLDINSLHEISKYILYIIYYILYQKDRIVIIVN